MAKSQARTEFQRSVDDVLTESINNNRQAREFILRNTARMAKEIEDRFGNDLVQVYIKGKSSLKLKKLNDAKPDSKDEKAEELGWSDFDNQIIINPYLPRAWWYEIFNQIHCYIRDEYLPSVSDKFFIDQPETLPAGGYVANHMQKVSMGSKILNSFKLKGPATDLLHAQKMQSNVLLCLANEYLHPLNFFDNTRTVFAKDKHSDVDLMADKYREANNFFPPSVIVLKDKNGKKIKKDGSIWMNCTIGKFLLYRLIVRYSAPGIDYNGNEIRDDIGVDRAKFRGEVVDISIPRRESEETINYWRRFKGDLRGLTNNNTYMRPFIQAKVKADINEMEAIRIPGWDYQLQENIIMLHEVLTFSSGSAHKFYKRLQRAWPALAAIQKSSELDPKSNLHSNLFKQVSELSGHYAKYKDKPSIQSFYKQLGSMLINDYRWDRLSPTLKTELMTKFLPNIKAKAAVHQKDVETMLTNFNVVKGSKDVKTSAASILQEAFSNKEEINNYSELLKHLFIVNKSNHAFGEKFKLNMQQIKRINDFRLALETSCNTGKNCWEDMKVKAKSKQPSTIDTSSLKKLIVNKIWGISTPVKIDSLLDGYPLDYMDSGLSPVVQLDNVKQPNERDAICYFCGILGSQLDQVGRLHLQQPEELEVKYFFPVVNLYLKCSKAQWKKLLSLYKSKAYEASETSLLCREDYFGDHVVQVNFIDIDLEAHSQELDKRNADLENQLIRKRVNDRLEINTLSTTTDSAYSYLEDMNAKLMAVAPGLEAEEKRAQASIRKIKPIKERKSECTQLEKRVKEVNQELAEIHKSRNLLISLYKELHLIRSFLHTCDAKGHIRDLIRGEADLEKAINSAISQTNTKLLGSKGIMQILERYGADKVQIGAFLDVLIELKTHISAIKINPHLDPVALKKDLLNYSKDYEGAQGAHVFASRNSDRNIVIDKTPYRILREQYINEYYHHYIGQLRDFYLLHWLDEERVQYKSNITNFKTQLARSLDHQK